MIPYEQLAAALEKRAPAVSVQHSDPTLADDATQASLGAASVADDTSTEYEIGEVLSDDETIA